MLGKENFVILPTGLAGGLICAALTTRQLKLPGRLFAAVLFTFIGAAAVFVERYLVGTYSIADGGYTGSLFVFHPTLATSLERARLYEFQAGDVIALVIIAALACGGSLIVATLRKRDLTAAQILSITCAVAAATQVLFSLVFLSWVQVHYLYPAAILTTISLACLWPAGSSQSWGNAWNTVLSSRLIGSSARYSDPDVADICVASVCAECGSDFGVAPDHCNRDDAAA